MEHLSGRYGFLGFGNMGGAILSGLLARGTLRADQALVYDPAPERMAEADALGVARAVSPRALAEACTTLMLAVKPQVMDEALAPLLGVAAADKCIISIMAGIPIAALETRFGADARIIRVMPNTPALVGAGAAALAYNRACTPEDVAAARAVFETVGMVELVQEPQMDAVTALSGSGPAYFFYLTECLVAAAVDEGLDADAAHRLAAQTLLGAGQLLVTTGRPPDVLREQVTSMGGVTFAALESLRQDRFADQVARAYRAAVKRSTELGNPS